MPWRAWARAFAQAHQLDDAALRARNPAGCVACRRPQLPQLHGLSGRTVVAEMIESGDDGHFLQRVRLRDNLGLQRYVRSEEHTSELQSIMRISYAVFCLKKKHII